MYIVHRAEQDGRRCLRDLLAEIAVLCASQEEIDLPKLQIRLLGINAHLAQMEKEGTITKAPRITEKLILDLGEADRRRNRRGKPHLLRQEVQAILAPFKMMLPPIT